MKKIIIINGSGGVGKDTFVDLFSKHASTAHISIVQPIKEIAKIVGWNGEKEEQDRKFLSDLKVLVDEYNDGNYRYVSEQCRLFAENTKPYVGKDFLFVDMREKHQIEKAVKDFGATTLLITRSSVPHITSNIADKGVFDIEYDYVIRNNASLEELERSAKAFIFELAREDEGE